MAKLYKNDGHIELEEDELDAYDQHIAEQERKGLLPSLFPWPDTIPLEVIEDKEAGATIATHDFRSR